MSDNDQRQEPPGNSSSVINGNVINSGLIQNQVHNSGIEYPSHRTPPYELFGEIERLLALYSSELGDPGTTARIWERLRVELQTDEPDPAVLQGTLERLKAATLRVLPLAIMVEQLSQVVFERMPDTPPRRPRAPRQNQDAAAGPLAKERPADSSFESEVAPVPITVYLSDETAHHDVEAAVEALLSTAGLTILDREDPVIGSWFRRMRATVSRSARSQVVRESVLTAAHIADARLVLAQDATITATMMQNVGPVLASLQPTKDAVVRLGAVLIVKVDWEVRVVQLTAAQQAVLDHQPQLATSPRDVIGAIGLLSASADGRTAPGPTPQAAGDR